MRLVARARTHDRPHPIQYYAIYLVLVPKPLEIHHFIWLTLNYVAICFLLSGRCCSNEMYTNIAPSVNRVIWCHRNAHLLSMANSVLRRCVCMCVLCAQFHSNLKICCYLNYGSYFPHSHSLGLLSLARHSQRTYFRYLISMYMVCVCVCMWIQMHMPMPC